MSKPSDVSAAPWVAIACAALGAVLFGLKGVVVKLAYAAGADAEPLLTWRLLIAAPVFAAVLAWRRERMIGWTWRTAVVLAVWGVVGFHIAAWVNFVGLQSIGAGLERVILFLYPLLVVLGSAWRDGQPPPRRLLIGGVVTWAGISVAWWHQVRTGQADPWGAALVAASAAIFAVYMVGSERVAKASGAVPGTALGMLAACAGMIVQNLLGGTGAAVQGLPSREAWMWCVVLACACTAAPVLLHAVALARLTAGRVAVISTVGPVATLAAAWCALGEDPGAVGLIGSLITLAGVWWCLPVPPPPASGGRQ